MAILIYVNQLNAQDLENIKKAKPFTLTGGIGLSYTSTINNDSTRLPMPNFWNVNGQVNIGVYGVVIPLSFIYSNGRLSFLNAFNQFGISPKYKWLTMHAGYRRMTFSNYTLSNQTFLGLGAEVHYKLLRFGGMFGRFQKAQRIDSSNYYNQIPGSYPVNFSNNNGQNVYSSQGSYARSGYAVKLGIGTDKNYVDLIYFKAKDKANSITDSLTRSRIKPEENFGLGLTTYLTFFKHYNLGFTAATSVYTYNTRADSIILVNNFPLKNVFNKIIPIRYSTQLQWAGEVNAGIHYTNFSITAQYKQIEPYYRSMGIVSFLSDLKSWTVSPSWAFFKQKLRFTNNFVFMHDNLNKYKQFTTYRNSYSSSISFNPNSVFGIDASYMGYTLNQQKARPEAIDSMQVNQQSMSFSLVPHLFFMKPKLSHAIVLVTSYTIVDGGMISLNNNKITNLFGTLTYSPTILKNNLGFTSGINFNQAITALNTMNSIGFIFGVSKTFFKNVMNLSNNNSYLINKLDGKSIGSTYTTDLALGFSFKKGHSCSLSAGYVNSPANSIYNDRDFSQFRWNVSYRYQFGKY